MIPWLALFTATTWVDLIGVALSKTGVLGTYLPKWYAMFGMTAVAADILIIVLGIALARFLVPGATGIGLVSIAVAIQLVHDVLFYGIILAVPKGQNRIMDLFKLYAAEGSWKILLADAIMVTGSIWGMETLQRALTSDQIAWFGILGFYSLLYLLFTKE